MEIKELNHIAIHVRDLQASVDFYETILGLPRLPRPSFDFPGAWFALGTQELHLIGDAGLPPVGQVRYHFALRIADGFAARRELEAIGFMDFRGPAPRPDGAQQIFLVDPDGHTIELLSL